MGQKVNPIGLRVGINRTWDSRWFAGSAITPTEIDQDLEAARIREERLKAAGISKVIIERAAKNTRVTVHTARPGRHHRQKRRRHREAAQGPVEARRRRSGP
jgi:small subunit ribosomal protein S3